MKKLLAEPGRVTWWLHPLIVGAACAWVLLVGASSLLPEPRAAAVVPPAVMGLVLWIAGRPKRTAGESPDEPAQSRPSWSFGAAWRPVVAWWVVLAAWAGCLAGAYAVVVADVAGAVACVVGMLALARLWLGRRRWERGTKRGQWWQASLFTVLAVVALLSALAHLKSALALMDAGREADAQVGLALAELEKWQAKTDPALATVGPRLQQSTWVVCDLEAQDSVFRVVSYNNVCRLRLRAFYAVPEGSSFADLVKQTRPLDGISYLRPSAGCSPVSFGGAGMDQFDITAMPEGWSSDDEMCGDFADPYVWEDPVAVVRLSGAPEPIPVGRRSLRISRSRMFTNTEVGCSPIIPWLFCDAPAPRAVTPQAP